MSTKPTTSTTDLMRETKEQMTRLREELEAMGAERRVQRSKQDDSDGETEGSSTLVPLSEATKTFLETNFSFEMTNSDCRKRVKKFGVPECDFVRCPKLNPLSTLDPTSTLPQNAIKADRYLS